MADTQFDPEAIHAYASAMIADASHVTRNYTVMGALLGFLIAVTMVPPLSFAAVAATVFVMAMGYVVGSDRAQTMRKDAQLALLQVRIEENTRAWISQSRVALRNLAQAAEQAVSAALAAEAERSGMHQAHTEEDGASEAPVAVVPPRTAPRKPVPPVAKPAAARPLAAKHTAAKSAAKPAPVSEASDDAVPSYVDAAYEERSQATPDFQYLTWAGASDSPNAMSDDAPQVPAISPHLTDDEPLPAYAVVQDDEPAASEDVEVEQQVDTSFYDDSYDEEMVDAPDAAEPEEADQPGQVEAPLAEAGEAEEAEAPEPVAVGGGATSRTSSRRKKSGGGRRRSRSKKASPEV